MLSNLLKAALAGSLFALPTLATETRVTGCTFIKEAAIPDSATLSALTHLFPFSIYPNAEGSLNCDALHDQFSEMIDSAHKYDTKVMVGIGGWGRSEGFSAATNDETRATFVANLAHFQESLGIDGYNMDWEFPSEGEQMDNYIATIEELQAAMPDSIEVGFATAASRNPATFPDAFFHAVDVVELMAYDMQDGESGHSDWEQTEMVLNKWAHFVDSLATLDSPISFDRSRINLCVPFYSRNMNNAQDALSYAQIVEAGGSPTADRATIEGKRYSYNGTKTLQRKTRHVIDEGFNGITIWAIDLDLPISDDRSLLRAIDQAVVGSAIEKESEPILLSYFPADNGVVAQEGVPYDRVSHFCWAFAGATDDGRLQLYGEEKIPAFIDSVTAHGNKPLLSIGGARMNASGSIPELQAIMQSDAGLQHYTDTLVAVCEQYGFTGIEVNWEGGEALLKWKKLTYLDYPDFTEAYSTFVTTLGKKLHDKGMTIGVDVYGGSYYGSAYPDGSDSLYTATIDRHLVMTGGAHGKWELTLWMNGGGSQPRALAGSPYGDVAQQMAMWAERGIPKHKLIASFVHGFAGYNVKGASNLGELYDRLGEHCSDGLGNMYYPSIRTAIESGEWELYGGGAAGSFLYNPMGEGGEDDELIIFNSYDDITYAADDLMRQRYGGLAYWLPIIDLPCTDSLALVNAIISGMKSDVILPEPAFVVKPTLWDEPEGTMIDLTAGALWDTTGSEDCLLGLDTSGAIPTATITVPLKANDEHWPGGAMVMLVDSLIPPTIDDADSTLDSLALIYRSSQNIIFYLHCHEDLFAKGWSHKVELPSTKGALDTLNLAIADFAQPAWTAGTEPADEKEQWFRPLDLSRLLAASFYTNGSYGQTTTLEIHAIQGYKKARADIEATVATASETAKLCLLSQQGRRLHLALPSAGTYRISLYNLRGQELLSQPVTVQEARRVEVGCSATLASGLYLLRVVGTNAALSHKLRLR